MRRGRLLHAFIRDRIEGRLRGRSWAWLARASSIPQSTLATQKATPKFSVATLLAISEALGEDISYFLPVSHDLPEDPSRDALDEIEDAIRRVRGHSD